MNNFEKGFVYSYNGISVLCIQDLDPRNLNETPSFYGVVVESSSSDVVRASTGCYSKELYKKTKLTIKDFEPLVNPTTGLWRKWFPKMYKEVYELQKPTTEPDASELELWNLKSADGKD